MSQEAMQNRQDLLRAGRRAGKDMPTGKYIRINRVLYAMLIPGLLNLII